MDILTWNLCIHVQFILTRLYKIAPYLFASHIICDDLILVFTVNKLQ
jgi:hypothetical protein